ncbi:hypothetical protein F5Y18DRAFT_341329 [Xylariaceae sp. FL1019]|nr:hypothetical protein F5Y18DRAFT_341329 [Xylariaceae sp. FL1019]
MSSGGSSGLGSKSLSAPTSYSPQQQHVFSAPQPSFDASSRRSGLSSPSFPASAAPRKGQATRKQHRNQRRSGLDDEDSMAEIKALRNASSRRGQTSITHLLNYSVPSRHYRDDDHHHRSSRRHPTWGPGSGHHPVDKARFVHANYRFVVSPASNYISQAADADTHLDWADILQILASAKSQTTACPICLSDPVAPRMAHCGHIFCLPCLLRFMNATTDNEPSLRKEARWKKCPICEDAFRLSETKPVRFHEGQENPLPDVGQDVVLRLMVRDAGSTLALPDEAGSDVANLGEDVPWHFAASVLDYARIMKGTNEYVIQEYAREMDDLQKQAQEDEFQFGVEDGDWTQRAIRAIRTAKDKLSAQGEDAKSIVEPATLKGKKPAGQKFHFYMAPPHLYLSPLDIRILKTKFGGFSNFPSTLLPRVEHISAGHVVDDALRKRAKYLAHLPQGCVISFLECDWTEIVPAEVLETFSTDLERRRKLHRDKSAQEDRERLQAERLEAAAIGRSTRRHFDNINEDRFDPTPVMNSDDFQPLSSVMGTTPPNPRPGFEHLAEMSTSPSASRTVWGTPAAQPTSPELKAMPQRPVDDGWLQDDLLGEAEIALQMEAFNLEDGAASASNAQSTGGGVGGSKKKKKQKITLMSTGGRRGN